MSKFWIMLTFKLKTDSLVRFTILVRSGLCLNVCFYFGLKLGEDELPDAEVHSRGLPRLGWNRGGSMGRTRGIKGEMIVLLAMMLIL
jgi:hypothetical protein